MLIMLLVNRRDLLLLSLSLNTNFAESNKVGNKQKLVLIESLIMEPTTQLQQTRNSRFLGNC
jgi:hypothetical protein